jgi:hypothetical protein
MITAWHFLAIQSIFVRIWDGNWIVWRKTWATLHLSVLRKMCQVDWVSWLFLGSSQHHHLDVNPHPLHLGMRLGSTTYLHWYHKSRTRSHCIKHSYQTFQRALRHQLTATATFSVQLPENHFRDGMGSGLEMSILSLVWLEEAPKREKFLGWNTYIVVGRKLHRCDPGDTMGNGHVTPHNEPPLGPPMNTCRMLRNCLLWGLSPSTSNLVSSSSCSTATPRDRFFPVCGLSRPPAAGFCSLEWETLCGVSDPAILIASSTTALMDHVCLYGCICFSVHKTCASCDWFKLRLCLRFLSWSGLSPCSQLSDTVPPFLLSGTLATTIPVSSLGWLKSC